MSVWNRRHVKFCAVWNLSNVFKTASTVVNLFTTIWLTLKWPALCLRNRSDLVVCLRLLTVMHDTSDQSQRCIVFISVLKLLWREVAERYREKYLSSLNPLMSYFSSISLCASLARCLLNRPEMPSRREADCLSCWWKSCLQSAPLLWNRLES